MNHLIIYEKFSVYNNFQNPSSTDEDIEDITESLGESLGCEYYILKRDEGFDIYLSGDQSSQKLKESLKVFNERIKNLSSNFKIFLRTVECFVDKMTQRATKDSVSIGPLELDKFPWSDIKVEICAILITLRNS